jgi:hypothetical protein
MLAAPKAELTLRAQRAEKELMACQAADATELTEKRAALRDRCAQLQQRIAAFEQLRKLDAADLIIKVCRSVGPWPVQRSEAACSGLCNGTSFSEEGICLAGCLCIWCCLRTNLGTAVITDTQL